MFGPRRKKVADSSTLTRLGGSVLRCGIFHFWASLCCCPHLVWDDLIDSDLNRRHSYLLTLSVLGFRESVKPKHSFHLILYLPLPELSQRTENWLKRVKEKPKEVSFHVCLTNFLLTFGGWTWERGKGHPTTGVKGNTSSWKTRSNDHVGLLGTETVNSLASFRWSSRTI